MYISCVYVTGESGAMSSMRRSLPASIRSRRSRREITSDDIGSRTRTPTREVISNVTGLIGTSAKDFTESTLVNGESGTTSSTNENRNIQDNNTGDR